MPTPIVLATTDAELADAWERQLPADHNALRLGSQTLPGGTTAGFAAVVVLDGAAEALLPAALARCPTIYVGEPRSMPFEQAKLSGRAKAYLSYEESATRLRDLLPLVEELAEKQSMLELLMEKTRRSEPARAASRPALSPTDAGELWDFLEGAVENLDTRDRLVTEFRRASRHVLHASHTVFFLREADGFRADRGTSFFAADDPLVAFFENHPAVVDGANWETGSDPAAELAVRNRLALWGARLLVPVHDNGRLLGLIALGVRDDGQAYNDADRARAVFFARLLRHCLAKAAQLSRLNLLAEAASVGAKYLPNTLVLARDEGVPRHVPLVVRDLIGQVRRSREVCRVAPREAQPFRAGAGLVAETGGVWAFWEEASGEVHDATDRKRADRRLLLHDIALTLSHELANSLVSLTSFRRFTGDKLPPHILETAKGDVARLEALNKQLGLMQTLHEVGSVSVDVREMTQSIGKELGISVEVGPDPIALSISKDLVEFALRSLIEAIAANRPAHGVEQLVMEVRSSGAGRELTALLSLKGRHLELEGILPEPTDESIPNQGRLGVFLAKEILRLHHGEIHAGPRDGGDGDPHLAALMLSGADLLSALADRLVGERSVQSVVLFGSRARADGAAASADRWSDIDLHIITSDPALLADPAWARSMPGQDLSFQVVRPASGGVRKVTLLFPSGEADMVVLPAPIARRARLAMGRGLHRRAGPLRFALNEFATMMWGGYRFLKGEKKWGGFYARVAGEMPGRRFDNGAVAALAGVFLCDLLWVLQKIDRGELVAAQRLLHRSLAETNFQLLEESRMRGNLPTFGYGRRVEQLVTRKELSAVRLSSRLDAGELRRAAGQSFAGMRWLMAGLNPGWRVPGAFAALLKDASAKNTGFKRK